MPPWTFTVIVIAFGVSSCDRREAAPASTANSGLSTPKAALKTYGQAMKRGDAAEANRAVIGVDPPVITALAELGASRNRLEAASVARFGEEGRQIAGAGRVPYTDGFDRMVDQSDVKIDGDRATIIQSPSSPFGSGAVESSKPIPLEMKKVNGEWKLDYSAMENTRDIGRMLPLMQSMIKINDRLADQIKAGTFATVDDARRAHARQMMQIMPAAPIPSSPTTSRPAS